MALKRYDLKVGGVELNDHAHAVDVAVNTGFPGRAQVGVVGANVDGVTTPLGRFVTPPQFTISTWISDALADGRTPAPEQILGTNLYADPSHEYGWAPFANGGVTPAGAGIAVLDTVEKHSGAQSIKMTNTTPRTVSRTNRWKIPYCKSLADWSNDGTGQTISFGANYQGRDSVRVTSDGTAIRLGLRNILGGTANYPNLEAGKTFWFSCDIYVSANAVGNLIALLTRDDPNGDSNASTFLSTINSTNVKGGWVRYAVKFTVNAGRTITGVYVRGASGTQPSGAYMDVDRILIEETTPDSAAPSTYFDGDTPADPGYGGNTYAWTGAAGASTSQQLAPGFQTIYKSVNLGTGASLGLANGDSLTCSVWYKLPTGVTTYGNRVLGLISAGFAISKYALSSVRDDWVRVSATNTVQDASQPITLAIYGGTQTDDVQWFDDFVLCKGSAPLDDFNGDTPAADGYSYRWTGTPGASSSQKYIPQVGAGDPWSQLQANYEAVLQAFTPYGTTVPVVQHMPDGTERVCDARIVASMTPEMPKPGQVNPIIRCQWAMDIPSIFWRDNAGSQTFTTSSTSLVSVPYLSNATAPITDGVFKVHGPITNPRIENGQGGYCTYTGTVADGSTWTVNAQDFTSEVDGVSVLSKTDYYHRGSAYLMELNRPYQVKLTGSGTGANTKLDVIATPKFYS